MNISVIIPAYNEENRIEPTIKKIASYLQHNFTKYEIIVVDDCSTDRTNSIVSKYSNQTRKTPNRKITILKNSKNMGKGYSVKRGILAANYPLVLFSDSDLATPIEELGKLLKFIKKYDVVIASRNMKGSDVRTKQPLFRVIIGKTFPKLVNLLVLRGIKDTQCGFKLFKTTSAKEIVSRQTFNGFCFDVEILLIAKKLGFKIMEVPVVWIDQRGSRVNPIRDSMKMLFDLFRIKCNTWNGRYK